MQSYNNFLKLIERTGRVSIHEAEIQTDTLLKDSQDDEWEDNPRIQIYDLLDKVLQSKQNGDVDDYHNYSVTFARIRDFDSACRILEAGLKKYPNNIDLLADYLQYYPMSSNDDWLETCKEYYLRLLSIDENEWNWRSFAFVLDFLMKWNEQTADVDEKGQIKLKALELSKKFVKLLPFDDRAYYYFYKVSINFKKMSNSAQKKLLNDIISKAEVYSVRCYVLLAETKLDNKEKNNTEYSEVIESLDLAISNSIDTKYSYDMGYLYLLRFIARASNLIGILDQHNRQSALLLNNEDVEESKNLDAQIIGEIRIAYHDYSTAKKMNKNSKLVEKAENYIKLLKSLSGIEFELDEDFI